MRSELRSKKDDITPKPNAIVTDPVAATLEVSTYARDMSVQPN